MLFGRTIRHLLTAGLLALMAGCATQTAIESDLGIAGAPDWVNQGINNKLKAHDGKYYYGFGSAPPMGARSLQTAAADNRARAQIAETLGSEMKVVTRDSTSTSDIEGERVTDSSTSRNIENRVNIILRDARIVAHWRDPETGVIYSLAELDYERQSSRSSGEEE